MSVHSLALRYSGIRARSTALRLIVYNHNHVSSAATRLYSDQATRNASTSSEKQGSLSLPSPGSLKRDKRGPKRSAAAKNSLRRVAVEAQRTRDVKEGRSRPSQSNAGQQELKTVTAICAASEYDLASVVRIIESFGHQIDPCHTDLYPQVVHVALPVQKNPDTEPTCWHTGDLFVFPSGTVVSWDIPDPILQSLVSKALAPAARLPLAQFEEENLDFIEDASKDVSSVKGDTILLGTRQDSINQQAQSSRADSVEGANAQQDLDTVLAKIAYSTGLARSTKLAVLETMLSDYFETTKSIPEVLSRGGRMPFTRSFISQKTGQLLNIRAQLNLYSELTDSLPDLFWDSKHELGLEGYYDQMSKALDTNIRIKILNEKMDYAQEIASVLRQQLSEKHGVRLEWIIILLIFVEVVFAVPAQIWNSR